MKKLIFLFLIFFTFLSSCSNEDDDDDAQAVTVLKNINITLNFGVPSNLNFDFFDDGRPLSGDGVTFTYDLDNKLVESTKIGGLQSGLPTTYFYDGTILNKINYRAFGPTDGIVSRDIDIIYNGTTIERRQLNESGELISIKRYTYRTTDYNQVLKFEDFIYPQSIALGLPNRIYDFEYDQNDNVIFGRLTDYNSLSQDYGIAVEFSVTYDDMKNPFEAYNRLNPVVYSTLDHRFDYFGFGFFEKVARRNKNNMTSINYSIRYGNDTSFTRKCEYEYNQDGYPISRSVVDPGIDNVRQTIMFEYY